MTTIKDLTTTQLQQIIDIKEQIETLQSQLDSIGGGTGPKLGRPKGSGRGLGKPKGGRRMSAAGRAAISAAAKARWAKYRGNGEVKADKPAKKKRTVSAAARAKMAAVARKRWKRVKAQGKTTL